LSDDKADCDTLTCPKSKDDISCYSGCPCHSGKPVYVKAINILDSLFKKNKEKGENLNQLIAH
jgi:hypothetical protein